MMTLSIHEMQITQKQVHEYPYFNCFNFFVRFFLS